MALNHIILLEFTLEKEYQDFKINSISQNKCVRSVKN